MVLDVELCVCVQRLRNLRKKEETRFKNKLINTLGYKIQLQWLFYRHRHGGSLVSTWPQDMQGWVYGKCSLQHKQILASCSSVSSDQKMASTDNVTSLSMALIGARDLSIAAAISTFWYAGGNRREWEMGVVILSGTFLCLVDSVVVWMRKGPGL